MLLPQLQARVISAINCGIGKCRNSQLILLMGSSYVGLIRCELSPHSPFLHRFTTPGNYLSLLLATCSHDTIYRADIHTFLRHSRVHVRLTVNSRPSITITTGEVTVTFHADFTFAVNGIKSSQETVIGRNDTRTPWRFRI